MPIQQNMTREAIWICRMYHSSPSLPPTGKSYVVSMTPDSMMKSDKSNTTSQTGSIMTNSSNEGEIGATSHAGRFLVRPRSADYRDFKLQGIFPEEQQ